MSNYELAVILNPDIDEEDVPQAMEKLSALVTKSGGEITETEHWGRRKLSYPIGHHAEGNYVVMRLGMEPGKTAELENGLNLGEDYLRHLLLRLDGK
ncbi:MAG: 30S ribosomal protein S6 [Dehalococcoidia bacterium]